MSEVKKIATRESYGNALAELGAEYENLVVLDADLAEATKTGIFKKEFPEITEAELAAKFSQGSGIHGVNYQRAFIQTTWTQQQTKFAWILLNSTIPIFEGWLEELKQNYFTDMDVRPYNFLHRHKQKLPV